MKAKIYPLLQLKDATIEIPCSTFLFSLEFILASLASGTSVIKNIPREVNKDLLAFSKQIGATVKVYQDKVVVKGIDNKLSIKNSMFVCENLKTIKQFLPLLASFPQPVGIKTSKENIESLSKYKEIIASNGSLYIEEENKIRLEKALNPLDLTFEGSDDLTTILSFIIAAPLLNGTSKIKLIPPVAYHSDYKTIAKIFRKFKVDIKLSGDMTLEIQGNQRYKACRIKTEMDSYISIIFGLLANHYKKKIKIEGYTRHSFSDGICFDYLNGKEFSRRSKYLSYAKKPTAQIGLFKANIIRGGMCLAFLLFLLKKKEGIITHYNENNPFQKTFLTLFETGFSKTNIKIERQEDNLIIKPAIIENKFQFDSKNNTYVAATMAILALVSSAPITIKNIDSICYNYPCLFENLIKLGAKIEYIHD